MSIGRGLYAIKVGSQVISRGTTKAAASKQLAAILGKRRNPTSPKIAAKVGREFLKAFDVDSDGELDKADIAILEHFNDPNIVIDQAKHKTGKIVGRTKTGDAVVEWTDGKTSTEKKSDLVKANGFRSWQMRRKAVKAYSRSLKATAKAQKARKRQKDAERQIRARRPVLTQKNPAVKVSPALTRYASRLAAEIGTLKRRRASLVRTCKAAGMSSLLTTRITARVDAGIKERQKEIDRIQAGYAKSNPGLIDTLATIAMGVDSAMSVHSRLASPKKKKRTTAKRTAKKTVRKTSREKKNGRPSPKKAVRPAAKLNPDAPASVQAYRTFHAKGLTAAINFISGRKDLTPAQKAALKRDLRDYKKPPTISNPKGTTVARKRNPSGGFEAFQGREADRYLTLRGPDNMPRTGTWTLGELIELRFPGKTPVNFKSRPGEKFYLLSDRNDKNLYIASNRSGRVFNPDDRLADDEARFFGRPSHVVYETLKAQFDDVDPVQYEHEFGEEGGERPIFARDSGGFGHFIGGDFTITPAGIRD